ncbi:uncharacterized protein LOC143376992 [Andrena cerasifolii]|uniref:uncharacterized protein LOC143376992 n=1 Tax=Andrena cerasifolii TaxID=2819439 RepID=UPI004038473B
MFTRIRTSLILIYGVLIFLYLFDETRRVQGGTGFISPVQNLSVKAFQDDRYAETNDTYKFLKLNISWLAPNSDRQPSSYSVMVTSIQTGNETNILDCPEGSILYTSNNVWQRIVVLPENGMSGDMPDLYIRPNCSYKVQVITNPRRKFMSKPPEVSCYYCKCYKQITHCSYLTKRYSYVVQIVYTVPDCIGEKCTCVNAKSMLPIPNVNVIYRDDQLVVSWSSTFNTFNVRFYSISIGVPLFVSKGGLPVYNMTKIGQVPSGNTVFSWKLKSNDDHLAIKEIKDGYKIAVSAINDHGCSGIEGNFIVHLVSSIKNTKTVNYRIWFIVIGVTISCILLFGILSFILFRNNSFFILYYRNSSRIHRISKHRSRWAEAVLQEQNILYVRAESEDSYKDEAGSLQVPFKSVKLTRKLGSGHFGKVYLGYLDDTDNTRVAVKMSRCVSMPTESEIQQQFIEEIEMMKLAGSHPHLVGLIGYCVQPDKPICILLEYMQGGDLLTYLHFKKRNRNGKKSVYTSISSTTSDKQNTYRFKQFVPKYINISNDSNDKGRESKRENWIGGIAKDQYLKFVIEIAMGMEHLEAKGITHRDLAARNILVSTDLTLKISDFGLSRNGIYVIKNSKGKTRHLPIRWMSPEALRDRAFSAKSDVWSFGVVLWEIGTLGSFPYSDVRDENLARYIIYENGRLEQPGGVPLDIYRIMRSCWAAEPGNRPDFTQLLSKFRMLICPFDPIPSAASNPCYSLSFSNKDF